VATVNRAGVKRTSGTPLLSVVMPCYGHERFVDTAVKSLWDQTFTDFEIVAVDDGSPDGTGAVLDSLAAASERPMRVLHTINQGAHRALNLGASHASAPYLAFLNDDDLFLPDRLAVFERVLRRVSDFVWGFTGVEAIGEDGQALALTDVPDQGRRDAITQSSRPLKAVAALPRLNTMVSSGNLVVEAATFNSIGGFRDFRFTHDWDLAVRLLGVHKPFVVERSLYRYRVHPENAFAEITAGQGEQEARRETEAIIARYEAAMLTRIAGPAFRGSDGIPASRDTEFAIKAALWGLGRLHAMGPAYTATRAMARTLHRVRRRWHER
jgi:glycosyltransferase involved in cell wall biosynthesis